MASRCPCIVLAALLLSASTSAHAHGEAVVFVLLMWIGVFGGMVAGVLEVLNPWRRFGPGTGFVIYLCVLALVACAVTRSLEAIPYAIGFGAFLGVVPFMALFFLSRFLAATVRGYRSARGSRGSNQG